MGKFKSPDLRQGTHPRLMIVQRYNYTPLKRESVDGKRHYCLPDGSKVPSVTTILDRTKPQEKREALANWKKIGRAHV